MNNYITTETLHDLFYGSDLVETGYLPYLYDQKNIKPKKNISIEMTPMSKMIYESVSTSHKVAILRDMIDDDEYIDNADDYDPDYLEKLENSELGFYMEDFICHSMKCPVCGVKSLRKYGVKNMPVVDVICVNTSQHIDKIKLFQIKITLNNNYFNRKKHILLVGSKKYGFMCHEVYGMDTMNHKDLLVGYICINMIEVEDNKYKIDNNKSFVLIPDINNHMNEKYYSYTGQKAHFGNEVLEWNPNMVNVHDIAHYVDTMNVDTNIHYSIAKKILNPYDKVIKKLIF